MNQIKLKITNKIILKKSNCPKQLLDKIKTELIFNNPKYVEAKKRGYWTGGMPKHLYAYKEDNGCLYMFRGYLTTLLKHLSTAKLHCDIIDQRLELPSIKIQFTKALRTNQVKSAENALKNDFGVLVAPCGSGKTTIALYIIAVRRQPTIVVVHTSELLEQWIERTKHFLQIPKEEIGIIGQGHEIVKPITITTVQTLCRRDLSQISKWFGQIIVDECHHTPATTFTDVASAFRAKYMLGLTATPYRKDGLGRLIHVSLGDTSAEITNQDLEQTGHRIAPEIIPRYTNYVYDYKEDELDYTAMISDLIEDDERNRLIVSDIAEEHKQKNYCIVLSSRKAHCCILSEMLENQEINHALIIGNLSKRKRQQAITDINNGNTRIIIATSSLAGEGLDIPKLNRLFLATPIGNKTQVKQYTGRILRKIEGKKDAKVYDYVDHLVEPLKMQYYARLKHFKSN